MTSDDVQENPHAPPATPTASMDHAVTVEREDAPHASPPPTRLPAAVEPAAQELPARPRLRVSYWFEGDTLKMESVLMTDRRERVHSETVELMTGSTLEKVHALLLTVAATRAKLAGRVAAPPAPPAEPSRPSSSSEPPPADAGADESSSSDETEPEAAERKTSPDGLKPAQPEPTE